MSKLVIEREIKMFVNLGIDVELANAIVLKKYGYDDLANENIENIKSIQDDLKSSLEDLVPFENTIIFINQTTLASSSEK